MHADDHEEDDAREQQHREKPCAESRAADKERHRRRNDGEHARSHARTAGDKSAQQDRGQHRRAAVVETRARHDGAARPKHDEQHRHARKKQVGDEAPQPVAMLREPVDVGDDGSSEQAGAERDRRLRHPGRREQEAEDA